MGRVSYRSQCSHDGKRPFLGCIIDFQQISFLRDLKKDVSDTANPSPLFISIKHPSIMRCRVDNQIFFNRKLQYQLLFVSHSPLSSSSRKLMLQPTVMPCTKDLFTDKLLIYRCLTVCQKHSSGLCMWVKIESSEQRQKEVPMRQKQKYYKCTCVSEQQRQRHVETKPELTPPLVSHRQRHRGMSE